MDRQTAAIITGGLAGALMLPACFVSPFLVLGCAAVLGTSLPFMTRN
jgi:hypothetical protein